MLNFCVNILTAVIYARDVLLLEVLFDISRDIKAARTLRQHIVLSLNTALTVVFFPIFLFDWLHTRYFSLSFSLARGHEPTRIQKTKSITQATRGNSLTLFLDKFCLDLTWNVCITVIFMTTYRWLSTAFKNSGNFLCVFHVLFTNS